MRVPRAAAVLVWMGVAANLVLAFPSGATTLRCRSGVRPTVFRRYAFRISQSEVPKLSTQLQTWASELGWRTGGVEGEDPDARPPSHTWDAILQTPTYGTAITVRASIREGSARVVISNNCWAPQENWRPAWQRVEAHLRALGYAPR